MENDSTSESSLSNEEVKKKKKAMYDKYYEKKKKKKKRKRRERSISSSKLTKSNKKKKRSKYYSSDDESLILNRKKKKKKKRKRKKKDNTYYSSSDESVVSDRKKKKKKRSKKYHNKSSESDSCSGDNNNSSSSSISSREELKLKKKKKEEKRTITVKELKKEREDLMKKHFNYTDECNPFGDNTLSTPFVWKLKSKYEKIKNDNKIKLTTNSLLENSISKIGEIEEVKKRREEREKEKSLLEDYRLQLEKQRNQINIKEYKEKEQLFFINQEIQSSNHRINHNNIQPVDIFRTAIKIINNEEVNNFHHSYYKNPFYNILEGLKERELENCIKQIKLFILHDRIFNEEKFKRYWESLLYFAEFYLDNLKSCSNYLNNENVNEKTNLKIKSFFENKNYDELTIFEEKIKNKIISDDTSFDVDYWNSVLLKIPYFKSKYILDEFHKNLCKNISFNDEKTDIYNKVLQNKEKNDIMKKEEKTIKNTFECKSPILLPLESFEDDKVHIYSVEEELTEREKINEEILNKLKKDTNNNDEVDDVDEENIIKKFYSKDKEIYDSFVRREKKRGIKDEIIMKDIALNSITNTLKGSLFITRKPLYFNRIKTSFDWNKYNKTHYDYENTPPKYICGYKFNIFYTNLLNKKQSPTWKLQPTDDENKILIIFHGGAPYLDIAFKIVNAEWSFDKNRGFRNVFDKGILQLYFNFKKKRYRR